MSASKKILPHTRDSKPSHQFVERLCQTHDACLRKVLRPYVPDCWLPDLMQEIYLRLLTRKVTEPIEFAKSYALRVGLNCVYMRQRRESLCPIRFDSDLLTVLEKRVENPHSRRDAIRNDAEEALADIFESVPKRWVEMVVLHKIHGLTKPEIAAQLGYSSHTVKKYVVRALRAAREVVAG